MFSEFWYIPNSQTYAWSIQMIGTTGFVSRLFALGRSIKSLKLEIYPKYTVPLPQVLSKQLAYF